MREHLRWCNQCYKSTHVQDYRAKRKIVTMNSSLPKRSLFAYYYACMNFLTTLCHVCLLSNPQNASPRSLAKREQSFQTQREIQKHQKDKDKDYIYIK
jgi:hypothetical protein